MCIKIFKPLLHSGKIKGDQVLLPSILILLELPENMDFGSYRLTFKT